MVFSLWGYFTLGHLGAATEGGQDSRCQGHRLDLLLCLENWQHLGGQTTRDPRAEKPGLESITGVPGAARRIGFAFTTRGAHRSPATMPRKLVPRPQSGHLSRDDPTPMTIKSNTVAPPKQSP